MKRHLRLSLFIALTFATVLTAAADVSLSAQSVSNAAATSANEQRASGITYVGTRAGLPATAAIGALALLTDDNRSLWYFNGTSWVATNNRVFNILDFGARRTQPKTKDWRYFTASEYATYAAANSVAIQTAIDAARKGAERNTPYTATVLIPEGNFAFDTTLNLDSVTGIQIVGASRFGTELVYTGQGASGISMRSAQSSMISNLTIAYSGAFTGDLVKMGHNNIGVGSYGDSTNLYFDNITFRRMPTSAGLANSFINFDQTIISGVSRSSFIGAKYGVQSCDTGTYAYVIYVRDNAFYEQDVAAIALTGALENWSIERNTFEPLNAHDALIAPNVAVVTLPGAAQQINVRFADNWIGDGRYLEADKVTLNRAAVATPQVGFGYAYGLQLIGNRFSDAPAGNTAFYVAHFEGLDFTANRMEGGGAALTVGGLSFGLKAGGNSLQTTTAIAGLQHVVDREISANAGGSLAAQTQERASRRTMLFSRQNTTFNTEVARFYGTNQINPEFENTINPFITVGADMTSTAGAFFKFDNQSKVARFGVFSRDTDAGTRTNAGVSVDQNSNLTIPGSLRVGIDGSTPVTSILSTSAALVFKPVTAQTTIEMTVTVRGAAIGDAVSVTPAGAPEAGLIWSGYVSDHDTVSIRLANITNGVIRPAARNWRVVVTRF